VAPRIIFCIKLYSNGSNFV